MKQEIQLSLFGPLGRFVERVPGTACYHLRPVGGLHAFCGRIPAVEPMAPRRRQQGWGRTPRALRCPQCDRHLAKIRER